MLPNISATPALAALPPTRKINGRVRFGPTTLAMRPTPHRAMKVNRMSSTANLPIRSDRGRLPDTGEVNADAEKDAEDWAEHPKHKTALWKHLSRWCLL